MGRLPDSEFQIDIHRPGIGTPVTVRVVHLPTGASGWDESRSQRDSATLARGRAEERAIAILEK